MVVINSSTFRSNQSKYFDMAANGENVVVTRNNRPSVIVSAVDNFRLAPTSAITETIVRALHEVKAIREAKINNKSARAFLNEL